MTLASGHRPNPFGLTAPSVPWRAIEIDVYPVAHGSDWPFWSTAETACTLWDIPGQVSASGRTTATGIWALSSRDGGGRSGAVSAMSLWVLLSTTSGPHHWRMPTCSPIQRAAVKKPDLDGRGIGCNR